MNGLTAYDVRLRHQHLIKMLATYSNGRWRLELSRLALPLAQGAMRTTSNRVFKSQLPTAVHLYPFFKHLGVLQPPTAYPHSARKIHYDV